MSVPFGLTLMIVITRLLSDHLEIFPMIFALGSDPKKAKELGKPRKKPTPRLTVNREQYSGPTKLVKKPEPLKDYHFTPPSSYSISRSRGRDWEYLLNPNKPGPLFCETRGKLLVMAAGNVGFLNPFASCY